jgi:hypothetical protein
MYGGQFKRAYGWYIKQAFYKFGLYPQVFMSSSNTTSDPSFEALRETCPPELLKLDAARSALWFGRDPGAPPTKEWQQQYSKAKAAVWRFVEDEVRQEFGVSKIGEGWVSETLLSMLMQRIAPGEVMLRHHRPAWLEGLELDIFLPGMSLGIEYQGQQHFRPIKAWGGPRALAEVQTRDARKADLCRVHGVRLLAVDYTEPLTEEHVRRRLAEVALQ